MIIGIELSKKMAGFRSRNSAEPHFGRICKIRPNPNSGTELLHNINFLQTRRARSEGKVRWAQPENGAVTRYFASIILRAEVQSAH
jgi:hypothetical protein